MAQNVRFVKKLRLRFDASSAEVTVSKLPGCHADDLLKSPGEIALVIVADLEADFGTVFVRRQKEPFRMLDSDIGKIIDKGNSHLLFEQMRQA